MCISPSPLMKHFLSLLVDPCFDVQSPFRIEPMHPISLGFQRQSKNCLSRCLMIIGPLVRYVLHPVSRSPRTFGIVRTTVLSVMNDVLSFVQQNSSGQIEKVIFSRGKPPNKWGSTDTGVIGMLEAWELESSSVVFHLLRAIADPLCRIELNYPVTRTYSRCVNMVNFVFRTDNDACLDRVLYKQTIEWFQFSIGDGREKFCRISKVSHGLNKLL